jgi:hypothetical protein
MGALYFEFLLTMTRLFDDLPDVRNAENTASIPELMKLLDQEDVIAELENRAISRRALDHIEGPISADEQTDIINRMRLMAIESAQEDVRTIHELLDEYKEFRDSHLLQRIRNIRNGLFAHTAVEPAVNNWPTYGDAEQLLDKTKPFVARIQYAVWSLQAGYEMEVRIKKENADVFWRYLKWQCGDADPTLSEAR